MEIKMKFPWRSWLLIIIGIITFVNTSTLRDRRNVNAVDPDEEADILVLDIPVTNKKMTLHLQRSGAVNADIPVFIGTGRDSFIQYPEKDGRHFQVYTDHSYQATFVMGENYSGHDTVVYGVFDFEAGSYYIEPLDTRQPSRQARYETPILPEFEPKMVKIEHTYFTLTKINLQEMMNFKSAPMVSQETENLQAKVDEFMDNSHFQGTFNFGVDILLAIDFSIFDKWVSRSRSPDYRAREADALNGIRIYFSNVLNGIAMRFSSIDSYGVRMSVKPVGIYIAKTEEASYWTESHPNKQDYHFTDAMAGLRSFSEWSVEHQKDLPAFDHALLFTGNNLFSGVNYDGTKRVISGLSGMMTVCGANRTAIVYDYGQYHSMQVAAHELGHSLGSYEDGYKKLCEHSNYIMGESSDHQNGNHMRFSECSVHSFSSFWHYLSGNGTSCLHEGGNYPSNWNDGHLQQVYLGQRYTINEQCKSLGGMFSFQCRDQTGDAFCEQMNCWDVFNQKCEEYPENQPENGTSCGKGMWCINKHCVPGAHVPQGNDPVCSDETGIIRSTTRSTYTCNQLADQAPWLCYDEIYRTKCCATCQRIHMDQMNCEYGDKDPQYCRTEVMARDCYDQDTEDRCCQTCARFRVHGYTGCEYGDKDASCADVINSHYKCYDKNSTCCLTCPRLQLGVPGCEWGDNIHLYSCDNILPGQCNWEDKANACCETCHRFKTGPPGCEYGDHFAYCSKSDCSDAWRRSYCCHTCADYKEENATTAPTTMTPKTSTTSAKSPRTSTIYSTFTSSGSSKYTRSTLSSTMASTKSPTTPNKSIPTSPIPNKSIPTSKAARTTTSPTTSPTTTTTSNPTTTPPPPTTTTTATTTTTTSPQMFNDQPLNSKPQITYSDEDSSCRTRIRSARDCYDAESGCCSTCLRHYTGNTTCPYGDHYSWCADYVARNGARGCRAGSNVRRKCCSSCAGVSAETEEGTCVDEVSWCSTMFKGDCYNQNTQLTCCARCKREKMASDMCPYGDHYSWCKPRHCTQERDNCCNTCPPWLNECQYPRK